MSGSIGDLRPGWRAATGGDLDVIHRIADQTHVGLPERPEVFAERFDLFPAGCLVLSLGQEIVGYGISYPWLLLEVPALDSLLGQLPAAPDCLYVHDVVVLLPARGHDAARGYVDRMAELAHRDGVSSLALVSVYDTHVLWARHGFRVVTNERLGRKLESYGATARYMVRRLD